MRYFSYRNKLRLRSLTVTILVIAIALVALVVGFFLYFQRFIVYTPTGAYLDMNTAAEPGEALLNPEFVVEQPLPGANADLVVDEGTQEPAISGPQKLKGFYITGEMLAKPDALAEVLAENNEKLAVLMDVKSIYGNFFYTSHLPDTEISTAVDAPRVDRLIKNLAARSNIYLIARVPALRDSAFALDNQACGLPLKNGALWMDTDSCYWLDPANDRVVSRLESIGMELKALGFDEVVFSDLYFPNSGNIAYGGDGNAAATEAAHRLSANLADSKLPVSFLSADPALAPYAQRLYVENVQGGEVLDIANSLNKAYPTLAPHLVFLTDSHDTRFAAYSVLAPAAPEPTP